MSKHNKKLMKALSLVIRLKIFQKGTRLEDLFENSNDKHTMCGRHNDGMFIARISK